MPAEYLRRAKQAESWARDATSPTERAAFEEIAALWRRLAERKMAQDKPG